MRSLILSYILKKIFRKRIDGNISAYSLFGITLFVKIGEEKPMFLLGKRWFIFLCNSRMQNIAQQNEILERLSAIFNQIGQVQNKIEQTNILSTQIPEILSEQITSWTKQINTHIVQIKANSERSNALAEQKRALLEKFGNDIKHLITRHEISFDISKLPKATGFTRIIQDKSLLLLKEFIRICEKYNLTYWLDFGSLLGAVRHKGFIPWDDDLDVGMPFNDYVRFKEVVNEELAGTEALFIDIPLDICKMVHKDFAPENKDEIVILWNWLENKQKIFIALDIFPYYYAKEELQKKDICNKIMQFFENELDKLKPLSATYQELASRVPLGTEIQQRLSSDKQTEYMYLGLETRVIYQPYVVKTEHIFPLKTAVFEGIEVSIPNETNILLYNLYGNYWQLPKDVVGHHILTTDPLRGELYKLLKGNNYV